MRAEKLIKGRGAAFQAASLAALQAPCHGTNQKCPLIGGHFYFALPLILLQISKSA
jgi:hypothetical protein